MNERFLVKHKAIADFAVPKYFTIFAQNFNQ